MLAKGASNLSLGNGLFYINHIFVKILINKTGSIVISPTLKNKYMFI